MSSIKTNCYLNLLNFLRGNRLFCIARNWEGKTIPIRKKNYVYQNHTNMKKIPCADTALYQVLCVSHNSIFDARLIFHKQYTIFYFFKFSIDSYIPSLTKAKQK